MSEAGPDAPEPVKAPEAPVAVVADAQTPVAPDGAPAAPETQAAVEKKAVPPRLPEIKTKEDVDRAVIRDKVDEMDSNITALQKQIDEEKDAGKQARLREKMEKDVAKRDEVYAEYKEMIAKLDKKIAEVQKELSEIKALRTEIAALQAFIQEHGKDPNSPKLKEVTDKTKQLAEKERDLKKATPEGREKELEAKLKAYTAERLRITEDAERRDEIGEADRTLAREMAIALGEIPPDAPADEKKDKGTPLTDEQKAKERELILDNRIDQIAFDLAKMLAGNVPDEDDTMGKFGFEAKRGLLMVMTFLGGDPVWTDQLSAEEKKTLGMTVTIAPPNAKGETLHVIKWDPIDLSGNDIQDVYEAAFGKDGWSKQMALLTPTTTVKELQDKVAAYPKDTKDPEQQNMIKFVDALVASGANSASGVQEFIKENSDKIIKILKPETAAPSSGDKAPEGDEQSVDPVKIIQGNKKLKNDTPTSELLKAIDPDIIIPTDTTPENAETKATEIVGKLTSIEAITAYQKQFEQSAACGVILGLPDMAGPLKGTFATALGEMKSIKELTTKTKTDLADGIAKYMIAIDGLAKRPCKEVLEGLALPATATEADKKEIRDMIAALDVNTTEGVETKAPENDKIKASEFMGVIEEKTFHEASKAVDVAKAVHTDTKDIETLSPDQITAKAKAEVDALTSEALITAFRESFNYSSKELAKMGVGADLGPSLASTFSNALTEIKKGPLTDKTKGELQAGIEAHLGLEQKVKDLTFKDYLVHKKGTSTDDTEKKDIDTLLAALKANNPPAEK